MHDVCTLKSKMMKSVQKQTKAGVFLANQMKTKNRKNLSVKEICKKSKKVCVFLIGEENTFQGLLTDRNCSKAIIYYSGWLMVKLCKINSIFRICLTKVLLVVNLAVFGRVRNFVYLRKWFSPIKNMLGQGVGSFYIDN